MGCLKIEKYHDPTQLKVEYSKAKPQASHEAKRELMWLSVDPLFEEYLDGKPNHGYLNNRNLATYSYASNNPVTYIDPDGKRFYFAGGAGNDNRGWNYIAKFASIFTKKGIDNFRRINASGGQVSDIKFTATHRNSPRKEHKMIDKAVNAIKADLKKNPLEKGEQLNLGGYSYGSVLQAQVALKLADEGIKVDNLVLIGSPISSNSDLYKALEGHKNIGNVIREDIKGDKLSNPSSTMEFIEGGFQNRDTGDTGEGPHFDFARPDNPNTPRINEGKATNKKIGQLADKLINEGVK